MADVGLVHVQVCIAFPDRSEQIDLSLPADATIADAVRMSGVLSRLPGTSLEECKLGIYGKPKPLDTVLREGDRIEIYRPLVADPKESRRERAAKIAARKSR